MDIAYNDIFFTHMLTNKHTGLECGLFVYRGFVGIICKFFIQYSPYMPIHPDTLNATYLARLCSDLCLVSSIVFCCW